MSRHLESTRATQRRCPTCRTTVLHAITEGLSTTVDANPLTNQAAEIAALLANRRTYTLTAMRKELIHRTAVRLRGHLPAGTIHAQHTCPPRQTPAQQLELPLHIGQQP